MKRLVALLAAIFALVLFAAVNTRPAAAAKTGDGKQIFRFDTFGDEQLWTATLQMHQALASVSPAAALGKGLKVDVDALPPPVVEAIRQGQGLDDPAVTIQLLKLNAVVGVMGTVSAAGTLESVGITCALCHSTVDNSLTTGVGRRLDGWPNRDLNVGAIVALSPVLTDDQRAIFNSWGPGKYDPRLQAFDGVSLIPLHSPTFPVVIPPAYGLRGVGFETFTADGPISYWNNYVGVTQMGGHGSFSDERLPLQPITQIPDLVTPKLPALLEYQLSLRAPVPPRGSFNQAAARRGEQLFSGAARCSTCHTPPTFTDVLSGPDPSVPFLHAPSEVGQEPLYASRGATGTGMYRTSPLRGVWQHPPYFHDGRAKDLLAVVNHYDTLFSLGLTAAQKADLVEYLKSL
jgi:hypothetical protein